MLHPSGAVWRELRQVAGGFLAGFLAVVAAQYLFQGEVEWPIAILLGVVATAGAWAGRRWRATNSRG
jgi:uncharacterized membrane protein YfcA